MVAGLGRFADTEDVSTLDVEVAEILLLLVATQREGVIDRLLVWCL